MRCANGGSPAGATKIFTEQQLTRSVGHFPPLDLPGLLKESVQPFASISAAEAFSLANLQAPIRAGSPACRKWEGKDANG